MERLNVASRLQSQWQWQWQLRIVLCNNIGTAHYQRTIFAFVLCSLCVNERIYCDWDTQREWPSNINMGMLHMPIWRFRLSRCQLTATDNKQINFFASSFSSSPTAMYTIAWTCFCATFSLVCHTSGSSIVFEKLIHHYIGAKSTSFAPLPHTEHTHTHTHTHCINSCCYVSSCMFVLLKCLHAKHLSHTHCLVPFRFTPFGWINAT